MFASEQTSIVFDLRPVKFGFIFFHGALFEHGSVWSCVEICVVFGKRQIRRHQVLLCVVGVQFKQVVAFPAICADARSAKWNQK